MTDSTRQTRPEPEGERQGLIEAQGADLPIAETAAAATGDAGQSTAEALDVQPQTAAAPHKPASATGPVVGGAVAGAIFGVLSTLGYHHWQAPPVTVADPRLAAIESRIATLPKAADAIAAVEKSLDGRFAALEQKLGETVAKASDASGRKIAALETQAAGLVGPVEERLKLAESRIETLAGAAAKPAAPAVSGEVMTGLVNSIKALEAATGQQKAAAGTIDTRLKTVEQALASPKPALSPVPGLHLAAAALMNQAIVGNRPLGFDAAALTGLGLDEAIARPLAVFSVKPLPDATALKSQFASLVATLPKPQAASGTVASVIDRAKAGLLGFVEVRRAGAPPAPSDASLGVIAGKIGAGDIAGALTDIAARSIEERAVLAPVVKAMEERQAALAALRKLEGDALAAASRKG